jgi:hypothetical protein
VTVIYAYGGKGLSSVTLQGDDAVTEVVDVEISAMDRPHYIVLSGAKAIIWRFAGNVENISRIIVLGSQYEGAARIGVIGVPPDRIFFTEPDLEKLKSVGRNSCLSVYTACEASAYFDIPLADRMELAGDKPDQRFKVDQFVEHIEAGIIRIPEDGWVEAEGRGRFGRISDGLYGMTGLALGRYEASRGINYIKSSQNHERGVIKLNASSVISPSTARDYTVLPVKAGIEQLLSDGALVGPDNPQFRKIYNKWNEEISKPYRSKLDENFLFSYKIDYIVTRSTEIPAGLDKTAFLVAEGVDTPKLSGIEHDACFFFGSKRTQVGPAPGKGSEMPRISSRYYHPIVS